MKITIDRHGDRKWDNVILDICITKQLEDFIKEHRNAWERHIGKPPDASFCDSFYRDDFIDIKNKFIIKQKTYARQTRLFERIKNYIRRMFGNSGK